MPQWKGQSRGNKLGYRIFIFVTRRLGVKPAYVLLRFVSFYFFLFSWSSSRAIYLYFRKRLGWGRWKSVTRLYSNYFIFGQTLLDKIVVMAGFGNRFTFHFDGEEHLREIVANGRGGILLSAHVGNWEVAGHLLNRLNTRVNVVMYDAEHRQIKHYLESVTGKKNFNVIVIREDLAHVYAIGEALAANELVCLHGDRFLEGNKIRLKSFLGEEAAFPLGPFALASGFKVPVSIVFAFKETATHYHFYGSKLLRREEGEDKSRFTDRLLNTFVQETAEKIKRYPEQWFNYYNFWAKPKNPGSVSA